MSAKQQRNKIRRRAQQDDGWPRWQLGVVRQQQPAVAAGQRQQQRQPHGAGQGARPQPGDDGGQHHQPHGHECAHGLKARHQIQDHQHQENDVPPGAAPAARGEKDRIDGLRQQGMAKHAQHQQRGGGHAAQQIQGRHINRQHGAEQQVQQIGLAAVAAYGGYAQRQASEVKGREVRFFAHGRAPAGQAHAQRHDQAGQQPACAHGPDVVAGDQIARDHARQHGVADGVAHQAHAAQLQQHAQGGCAQRQADNAQQGLPHEVEFNKGLAQPVPQHTGQS